MTGKLHRSPESLSTSSKQPLVLDMGVGRQRENFSLI